MIPTTSRGSRSIRVDATSRICQNINPLEPWCMDPEQKSTIKLHNFPQNWKRPANLHFHPFAKSESEPRLPAFRCEVLRTTQTSILGLTTKMERKWWLFATCLRVSLILYGLWHDSTWSVKYTDGDFKVDYSVFTDGARLITEGRSPYDRATYRYSPLLAIALVPNILIHSLWGKILFASCDLAVGFLLEKLIYCSGEKPSRFGKILVLVWLFNPLVINVSTRGNSEALVSLFVLATIYALKRGMVTLAGLLLGFSIHLKLYPIIYSLALVLSIPKQQHRPESFILEIFDIFKVRRRIIFVFSCMSALAFLTVTSYCMYGDKFLQEAVLYHVTRTDHRHNFSIYFYELYLAQNSRRDVLSGLLAFVPQVVLSLAITARYAIIDVGTCVCLQTITFVALNKVNTAQYWVWYMALLPLALRTSKPWTQLQIVGVVVSWIAGASCWLWQAYQLEMLGQPTWCPLLAASTLFLFSHIALLAALACASSNPLLSRTQPKVLAYAE